MTKRGPTITRRPERMTHGDLVLDSGPDDRLWLMMRDWMARMEHRFETMEYRFGQMETRLERVEYRLDEHIVRTDERYSQVQQQISALTIAVTELTATVTGIDRRLCVLEGKVDDLVAWKHRIWGVVVALGVISGCVAFAANLLARHIVG